MSIFGRSNKTTYSSEAHAWGDQTPAEKDAEDRKKLAASREKDAQRVARYWGQR
ncbi:hypothetical protein [Streptomyces sp. UH6]|uniref:hypothetical protein n=1 Tax=Streptomyces sp. UH6 TaxID=2748379 RepID=UPI0015D50EFD|nr:hypothetical protein [Streptomyces sp. UH6]NYV73197.1 hypothetical protein [Streptomyces sp. UH6]